MKVSDIKEIDKAFNKIVKVEKNRSGLFAGWIDEQQLIAWVVSPHRMDRRTGAVECASMSSYAKELYKTISLGIPLPGYTGPEFEFAGSTEIALDSMYTLHYYEKFGRYKFGKMYVFEAPDVKVAWKKANSFMLARKVSVTAMKNAVLKQDDLSIPNPFKGKPK